MKHPLKVHYVTVQFPVWPEAFAINDVEQLASKGARMSVHSLRGKHEGCEDLIRDRKLDKVDMSWFTAGTLLRFPLLAARNMKAALYMAGAVIARNRTRPVHLLKGLASLPRCLEIFDALRRRKPDVVHIFWGHYPSLVALAVRKFLPSTVLTLFLGAYDLLWGYGCTPAAARCADGVFTHTGENLGAIREMGVREDRLRLAYRGVNLELARIAEQPRVPFSIATAGKLVPEKRFGDVLRVIARLQADWPQVSLTLIGDGPDRQWLEKRAEKLGIASRVRFTGAIRHREVFEELGRSEIFLFLSQKPSERLPNVIKEAIACGCVPVVSRTAGIEELIPDPDHGVVVSSPLRASNEIALIWSDPQRAETIRNNARRHLREHFDLEKSMDRYVEFWEELRARKRATGRVAPAGEGVAAKNPARKGGPERPPGGEQQ